MQLYPFETIRAVLWDSLTFIPSITSQRQFLGNSLMEMWSTLKRNNNSSSWWAQSSLKAISFLKCKSLISLLVSTWLLHILQLFKIYFYLWHMCKELSTEPFSLVKVRRISPVVSNILVILIFNMFHWDVCCQFKEERCCVFFTLVQNKVGGLLVELWEKRLSNAITM